MYSYKVLYNSTYITLILHYIEIYIYKQEYGFVNNARVVIKEFRSNSIRVETLDKKKKQISLPRIKFRFRAAYGQSYTMIRLQFPLKLGMLLWFELLHL